LKAPEEWLIARAAVWDERMHRRVYAYRYRSEPEFRAKEIARVAQRKRERGRFDEHVRRVVKGKLSDAHMRAAIGYGREELLAHLVSRFTEGMTLDALIKGDIHIDHNEPVSWFDPTDPMQLRYLWRLDNVQPLWPRDNSRKWARTVEQWRMAA
jgi:hypothetical protein